MNLNIYGLGDERVGPWKCSKPKDPAPGNETQTPPLDSARKHGLRARTAYIIHVRKHPQTGRSLWSRAVFNDSGLNQVF